MIMIGAHIPTYEGFINLQPIELESIIQLYSIQTLKKIQVYLVQEKDLVYIFLIHITFLSHISNSPSHWEVKAFGRMGMKALL